MSEIRRGSAAILEAAETKGGGSFRPYLPSIFWKDDREERYVLFLNEIDEVPTFDMIQFIPTEEGNGWLQEAVSKTDQCFGEKKDAFVEQWEAKVVRRSLAIAVELEPVIEVVNKRRKPKGFEIKTVEYERKIVDDDGEVTDETEVVTAPAVGYISQSPSNFFKLLANLDANEYPITGTAIKITRLGKDKHTAYEFIGYDETAIDTSNLAEYVDGISYLNEEMEEILERVEDLPEEEVPAYIGQVLLDKKEEELLDPERYDELLEGVTESMAYNKSGGGKGKGGNKGRSQRVSKPASRRSRRQAEPEEEPDEPTDEGGDVKPQEEEKPATRTRRTRTTSKAPSKGKTEKAASKAGKSGGKESSGPRARMQELRARVEAKTNGDDEE